jgi:hypothetical protein
MDIVIIFCYIATFGTVLGLFTFMTTETKRIETLSAACICVCMGFILASLPYLASK